MASLRSWILPAHGSVGELSRDFILRSPCIYHFSLSINFRPAAVHNPADQYAPSQEWNA